MMSAQRKLIIGLYNKGVVVIGGNHALQIQFKGDVMPRENFSEPDPRIKNLLLEKGETVSRFSYFIGVSHTYGSRIANGYVRPKDPKVVKRIIDYLGMPESEIFPTAVKEGGEA